jgi:asparagine synthase (glutamine-hydrolysing)
MCGVAGLFDRGATRNTDALAARALAMGESLRHRGPDGDGTWVDAAAGIAFAHRRLAVIAPTPEGAQPAHSQCGRYVLTFNGEIYNFRELAHRLAEDGHPVETNSDTVVLAEAVARWGVAATAEACIGMFAFAVFDRQTRTLCLVRDRLGIKPLYWARQGEVVAFGSEIKAIRAAGVIDARIDANALARYMRFAYVPAPATIYCDVHKLAPGTILTIGPEGEPSADRYWDLESIARRGQENTLDIGSDEANDALERLLQDAVSDRLISDVPLGAWLSGGIDSSCVVALMQAASATTVRTFSIGFPALDYDEAAHARAIANHLGTDHQELIVTPQDAIDCIASLPHHYDEPFADSSQIPTFLLSRLTRDHATVALSGDGGDEVFAGYNRYTALPAIERRFGPWPPAARHGLARILRFLSPGAWDAMARAIPRRTAPQFGDKIWKAASAIEAASLDAAYLSTVSQWAAPDALVPAARGADRTPRLDAALEDPVARMQLADTLTYLPDDILTKVDRASMAHALEVRVPLLDHRVVEFAWQLPRRLLVDAGRTKRPLRGILARHVPESLFARPKSGFAIPIGDWLRGPLRDWAEDLLSEEALGRSGLLAADPIRETWAAHLSGARNLQNALWAVLMFQLWQRDASA